jgi:hypothetical protein
VEYLNTKMAVGTLARSAVVLSAAAALAQAPAVTFDADTPGAPPPGMSLAAWRQPSAGAWLVRRQASNGYLAHDAAAGAAGYAIALTGTSPLSDVQAAVRVRFAGGTRAGGLVWRYQDDTNFYAAVLDLSRRQVALWRISAGNRVVLEVEDDLELDPDAWHTLKIVHDEGAVRVSLGGIRVFTENDHRGSRAMAAGRVGVIAKGDAGVWFDDLRIEARRGR